MSDWGRSEWQAKPNQAALRRLAEQEAARGARKVHAFVAVVVLAVLCIIVAALVVL